MAKEFKETYPEEVPSINSIQLKTADGLNTINSITKPNNNENSIEKTQQELMNKKGFEMVGKKGHSFPMLQPDPVEEQKKKMMEQQGLVKPENRAGSAAGRNMLVNNPNNPQPMNKVSANVNSREQLFNNIASNPGQPFPDASTTPPAPIFPPTQGGFSAYSNPKRTIEDLSSVDIDVEGGLGDSLKEMQKELKLTTKGKDNKGMKESEKPAMYDGLRKALVGDQENLPPHLQKEILDADEAPALIDYDTPRKVAKAVAKSERKINKADVKQRKQVERKAKNKAIATSVKSKINEFKVNQANKKSLKGKAPAKYQKPSDKKPKDLRTTPMTAAQKKKYEEAVQSYKDSTASWVSGKGPEPKLPDYDSFKAPGMHEQHTQISKANVNAAMRDDAAHASYLKRDITYDNRHGGSKKQMTADEKHISKLAGDIKYDVKKKRKYDNV